MEKRGIFNVSLTKSACINHYVVLDTKPLLFFLRSSYAPVFFFSDSYLYIVSKNHVTFLYLNLLFTLFKLATFPNCQI